MIPVLKHVCLDAANIRMISIESSFAQRILDVAQRLRPKQPGWPTVP